MGTTSCDGEELQKPSLSSVQNAGEKTDGEGELGSSASAVRASGLAVMAAVLLGIVVPMVAM